MHEANFRDLKIFTEFSDSVLFTSDTNFQGNNINVQRNYNNYIFEFIEINKPNRIIHTLGNNKIKINLTTKPKENNLGINGFQGFVDLIVENCEHFETISKSPSGRAVNVGGQNYYQNLKEWLQNNLEL